jgi:uncharacterized protein involved in exopolysaccharide biosynthesis
MKKNNIYSWLTGVLLIAVSITAQGAFAQTADFEIKDGVLVKYRGNAAEVVVPAGVTAIGDRAFSRCPSLKPELRAAIEKRFGESVFK